MSIWALIPIHEGDGSIGHLVCAYSLIGTIRGHFKYGRGFSTLIPFLKNCRLTRNQAFRLRDKLKKEENNYDN